MTCGPECSMIFVNVSKSLTTTFAIMSTAIVLTLIFNHIAHFTNPFLQKKIIGKDSNNPSHLVHRSFLQHKLNDRLTVPARIRSQRDHDRDQSDLRSVGDCFIPQTDRSLRLLHWRGRHGDGEVVLLSDGKRDSQSCLPFALCAETNQNHWVFILTDCLDSRELGSLTGWLSSSVCSTQSSICSSRWWSSSFWSCRKVMLFW